MAQETIRVNCVESVYMDKGHPYSNQGKTSELVIHSTNSKTKHHEIQDLTLLQFDIPDEIKKHKIISASLCFNAMVDSSYNWIYGDYRTELYLMTSPGLSWEFSDDIYQSEYRKYVEYDDFLGERYWVRISSNRCQLVEISSKLSELHQFKAAFFTDEF